MRVGHVAAWVALLGLVATVPAYGQAPRLDAIWARTTDGAPITLDGVLDEPGWGLAESIKIQYGVDTGIPGSGWQIEGPFFATDSTCAVIKLLVEGNKMYLGAVVPDSSIGGTKDFNRFDGFLMAIKNHAVLDRPAPPAEYFYSWWYPEDPNHDEVGKEPAFVGMWGSWPPGTPSLMWSGWGSTGTPVAVS